MLTKFQWQSSSFQACMVKKLRIAIVILWISTILSETNISAFDRYITIFGCPSYLKSLSHVRYLL